MQRRTRVCFKRPGSNAQYCNLKSRGYCVDYDGTQIIDVRIIKSNLEKDHSFDDEVMLQIGEKVIADKTCSCGEGRCDYTPVPAKMFIRDGKKYYPDDYTVETECRVCGDTKKVQEYVHHSHDHLLVCDECASR